VLRPRAALLLPSTFVGRLFSNGLLRH